MFVSNSVTPLSPARRYTLAARSCTRAVMRATSACAATMPACDSAIVCFAWSISYCLRLDLLLQVAELRADLVHLPLDVGGLGAQVVDLRARTRC